MLTNKLISICIPTYQRPELLNLALESCFVQQYEPLEIIVGDDSKDDATEKLVRELQSTWNGQLHYVRNVPSLGQTGNVNMLFELAKGDRIVLLHDDDLLLPNAIVDLDRCWQIEPDLTAAFGKQYLISMAGEILQKESEELNTIFYKTAETEGLQPSSIDSAILQQFPNNSYMVLSSAARSIKYKERDEVGDACDYDFGIRLALNFDKFYFINKYTAKYRITDGSICRQNSLPMSEYMCSMLQSLMQSPELAESSKQACRHMLKSLAPLALKSCAIKGRKKEALNIYLSEFYSLKKRLSLQGIYYLMLIFFPGFENINSRKWKLS